MGHVAGSDRQGVVDVKSVGLGEVSVKVVVLDGFVAKDDSVEARVREEVRALTARFPIYS